MKAADRPEVESKVARAISELQQEVLLMLDAYRELTRGKAMAKAAELQAWAARCAEWRALRRGLEWAQEVIKRNSFFCTRADQSTHARIDTCYCRPLSYSLPSPLVDLAAMWKITVVQRCIVPVSEQKCECA